MIEVTMIGDDGGNADLVIKAPSRLADVISRIPGLRAVGDDWVGPVTPALLLAIGSFSVDTAWLARRRGRPL